MGHEETHALQQRRPYSITSSARAISAPGQVRRSTSIKF
jgi:hypothetical protein